MRQVRWAGWTMGIATALVFAGLQTARADIASDKPAAILIYPKIAVDTSNGVETVVRVTNTNQTTPINLHCFFIDADSHCTNDGTICNSSPTVCTGGGVCVPGWQETDFNIVLTPNQPIDFDASVGLADSDLPLPTGQCQQNPFVPCGSDADCNPFPGGHCTLSNAGTRVPPVAEDPFEGELKCIAVDDTGTPVARNDLKGEAILETITDDPASAADSDLDVASYNALGIQATGTPPAGPSNVLTLGGSNPEYNGCPNFLILNNFFDGARDPVPGSDNTISTNLVLVPCSEDLLRQIPGSAVVQYLVFNEFEQRFSTSRTVNCFQDLPLCNIDTPNCSRSIFNVSVAGTLTGQTRLQPLGVGVLPSGLLGVAVEKHEFDSRFRSAAFNLDMSGSRSTPDTITIP